MAEVSVAHRRKDKFVADCHQTVSVSDTEPFPSSTINKTLSSIPNKTLSQVRRCRWVNPKGTVTFHYQSHPELHLRVCNYQTLHYRVLATATVHYTPDIEIRKSFWLYFADIAFGSEGYLLSVTQK